MGREGGGVDDGVHHGVLRQFFRWLVYREARAYRTMPRLQEMGLYAPRPRWNRMGRVCRVLTFLRRAFHETYRILQMGREARRMKQHIVRNPYMCFGCASNSYSALGFHCYLQEGVCPRNNLVEVEIITSTNTRNIEVKYCPTCGQRVR